MSQLRAAGQSERALGADTTPERLRRRVATDRRDELLRRKEGACTCGGTCPRCRAAAEAVAAVPAGGLRIGAAHDALEHEADRMADAVTSTTDRPSVPNAVAGDAAASAPSVVHDVLNGPGHPLDPPTRAFMEPRLGMDLGDVRLHHDDRAADSARAVQARAYTVGTHIVFGAGQYAPDTSPGRWLLAHELAHVGQQGNTADPSSVRLRRSTEPPPMATVQWRIIELRQKLEELNRAGVSTKEQDDVREELDRLEALVSAGDPIRRQITYSRQRLRELRAQMIAAPRSSAREPIAREVREHEVALRDALVLNVDRLRGHLHDVYLRPRAPMSDPDADADIAAAMAELRADETELVRLGTIFSGGTAASVGQKYKKEVRPLPGGGCMTAVYKGLESIYSPDVSKSIKSQVQADSAKILKETGRDTNSVDRIMETLREHGHTGPKTLVRYNAKTGKWTPRVEQAVRDMVQPEFLGWYFFGLSVSGGYHSVVLAVDNSEGEIRIYWMDQYAKGFSKDVTGKVDQEMKSEWLHPSYGYTDSTVWQLLPDKDFAIEVP